MKNTENKNASQNIDVTINVIRPKNEQRLENIMIRIIHITKALARIFFIGYGIFCWMAPK